MNTFTIKNAVVITDVAEKRDVLVKDGIIAGIGNFSEGDIIDGEGMYLMAGFIDTHIHGVNGVGFDEDFSSFDDALTYEAAHGITTIACTSGTHHTVEHLCKAFDHIAVEAKNRKRGAKIAGIHAEGPCVSPARKGAMDAASMIDPSAKVMNELCSHGDGLLKIITVAPELDGAKEGAEVALSHGVKLSMGHTNATAEEALRGIDYGFSRVTHTCNGMRPFLHRDPGILGVALTDDRLMCEMICDFVHLSPIAVKLVYKAKGAENICLISDTGRISGLPEADYKVYGIVRHSHDRALFLDDGTLAGSWYTVLKGVQNLHSIGVPLTDISVMASANPAKALDIADKTGAIKVGLAADLVLLNSSLEPVKVFVDGVLQ